MTRPSFLSGGPIVVPARGAVRPSKSETTSQMSRYPVISGPTADSADAVGYGEGMGCFAAMLTRSAA